MYRWDARDYQKYSSEQQKWAKELIQKLDLRGDERILDIGCGDGKVTAEIAQSVPEGFVIGIDNSEEMIHLGRETFPKDKFFNLSFQLKDVRHLDFNGEFDIVFSNASLHWVVDHLPVLRGIRKSLKPSGRILIQMGGRGNAAGIIEALETMIKDEKWQSYFTLFSFPYGFYGPDEYQIWLKEAGLKAKCVELIPQDMIHKGREGLSTWLRTTWLPYTQRIPALLRQEFIAGIVDHYIENHPVGKNNTIHVQMMRLEINAYCSP